MSTEEASDAGKLLASEASFDALVVRLQATALEPGFQLQRQLALSLALRAYQSYGKGFHLNPLPEEFALAELYLYADYYPDDGQLSLIEQVRDTITTHVPEEERVWLDPLRHSYMDLLEITSINADDGEDGLTVRSLGSGREYRSAARELSRVCRPGQVLLTRLIRLPDRAIIPNAAIILSASIGRSMYDSTNEWRRAMEAESGSFELGEWEEFAKRFGYVLLWQFAQARFAALIRTDASISYRTAAGQPFLYAVALYDHHEFLFLADGLDQLEGLQAEQSARSASKHLNSDGRRDAPRQTAQNIRTWMQYGNSTDEATPGLVARVTLTPTQLIVECESR
ncbi:MAG: hypothetical protein V3U08_01810, partial [Nitrospirales bacterium]